MPRPAVPALAVAARAPRPAVPALAESRPCRAPVSPFADVSFCLARWGPCEELLVDQRRVFARCGPARCLAVSVFAVGALWLRPRAWGADSSPPARRPVAMALTTPSGADPPPPAPAGAPHPLAFTTAVLRP